MNEFFSGNGAKRIYRFSLPSVCGEAGRKVEVHHERLLAEKLILEISGQKKEIVETNKKVREKSL